MTPAQRAYAIHWAKSLATPVVSCVQARLSPAHLLERCSREDLQALVIVLAEAADPAVLRAVTEVRDDDGRPDMTRHQVRLRTAHSQVVMLRRRRWPVPERLKMLESAYQQDLKKSKAATEKPDAA